MKAYEAAGLNSNESKVYETLLLLGKSTVTKISKQSGLERTMLYGILSRLAAKGLVTRSTEKKITLFAAAPPNALLNIINNKKRTIEDEMDKLNKIYEKSTSNQDARIYSGKTAIKNLLNELLDENQTWYVIGGTKDIKETLDSYVPQFHRKRKEKKIMFNVIFTKESKKRASELKIEKYTKIKFLPKDFAAPMHVAITGSKVAFNLWGESPLGILIESEEVAISFKQYFNFLWKLAKE